jgi:2-polyprenyl-3-methyl-5-hydroxy-6-metoxy-1,4-benzoquinol methylase
MSTSQEEVSKEWNVMAGEWDDLASSYRDAFETILWKQIGLTETKSLTVLDFGCGTGLLAEKLQSKVKRVVCVDAAPLMVEQVEAKIRAREWSNVQAYCLALAHLKEQSDQDMLREMEGKVDLIVASSVLSFIPREDLSGTLKALGKMLKSGGILCHSDWPKTEKNPEGLTEEVAMKWYEMAGLTVKSATVISMNMMGEEQSVFVGAAVKPWNEH